MIRYIMNIQYSDLDQSVSKRERWGRRTPWAGGAFGTAFREQHEHRASINLKATCSSGISFALMTCGYHEL